ncbi:MAG: add, partial [Modestobacter sp.]|nr:add [Modestobacter sp.]
MPAAPLTAETLARAPKVLLHDHLDGGLRPETILELAEEVGYRELPADEPEALG